MITYVHLLETSSMLDLIRNYAIWLAPLCWLALLFMSMERSRSNAGHRCPATKMGTLP